MKIGFVVTWTVRHLHLDDVAPIDITTYGTSPITYDTFQKGVQALQEIAIREVVDITSFNPENLLASIKYMHIVEFK